MAALERSWSRWEGALNMRRMTRILNGETAAEADEPEEAAIGPTATGTLG
jgi:hypothetical protein